jgi:hypothetical protein
MKFPPAISGQRERKVNEIWGNYLVPMVFADRQIGIL